MMAVDGHWIETIIRPIPRIQCKLAGEILINTEATEVNPRAKQQPDTETIEVLLKDAMTAPIGRSPETRKSWLSLLRLVVDESREKEELQHAARLLGAASFGEGSSIDSLVRDYSLARKRLEASLSKFLSGNELEAAFSGVYKGLEEALAASAGGFAAELSTIEGSLRRSDRVFRFGGDEFVAICLGDATRVIEHLVGRIERVLDGVTISAGAAAFPADARDPTGLVRIADGRMYENKRRRGGEMSREDAKTRRRGSLH